MELIVSAVSAAFGLVIVGVLSLTVCGSAVEGSIGRNAAVGIRTKETMKSDAAWLAGHRAADPVMTVTGWVALVLAAALVLSAVVAQQMPVIVAIVGVAGYAAVIVGALRAKAVANRAARAAG